MDSKNLKGILNEADISSLPFGLPFYQIKTLEKYRRCRTASLGGHAQYCENNHLNGIWYNSCKSRGCPQCQNMASEQWLAHTSSALLDCPHHHVIFTIPSELNILWQYNRAVLSDILFEAVHKSLKKFYLDTRYLEAQPGILSTLHTWGRDLSLHPHLHVLISHGGINNLGEWVEPKKKHLFPQKPVMMVYRGILLSLIRKALEADTLVLPPSESVQSLINLTHFLGRKAWVVHFCQRYDYASGVAKYLARYVKNGPVKNSQIKHSKPGFVRFQYKSHVTKRIEVLHVTRDEFIRRLSHHVPLPKKPSVRYFGLYSASGRIRLNQVRLTLKQLPVPKRVPINWIDYLEERGFRPLCQECGLPLTQKKAIDITPLT